MGLKGKKKKKGKSAPEPAPEPAPDAEDGEDEEDPLGDQSWAQSKTEADFTAGVDSMFADMFGGSAEEIEQKKKAEEDALRAQGIDPAAKVAQMGDESEADAAAKEAAEAKAAEESAAAEAAREAERKARAEKRASMSAEDKKAKLMCTQYRKKAEEAKANGNLADNAKFEEGLQLLEAEDW